MGLESNLGFMTNKKESKKCPIQFVRRQQQFKALGNNNKGLYSFDWIVSQPVSQIRILSLYIPTYAYTGVY